MTITRDIGRSRPRPLIQRPVANKALVGCGGVDGDRDGGGVDAATVVVDGEVQRVGADKAGSRGVGEVGSGTRQDPVTGIRRHRVGEGVTVGVAGLEGESNRRVLDRGLHRVNRNRILVGCGSEGEGCFRVRRNEVPGHVFDVVHRQRVGDSLGQRRGCQHHLPAIGSQESARQSYIVRDCVVRHVLGSHWIQRLAEVDGDLVGISESSD